MAADAVRDRRAGRNLPTAGVRPVSDSTMTTKFRMASAVALTVFSATAARAQIDVGGDWDHSGGGIFGFQEEFIDRGGGPDLGDYAGLPINDALRYKASLYSPSWLTGHDHPGL